MNARKSLFAIAALLLALAGCQKELPETEKAMTAGDLLMAPPKCDYAGAREQYAKAIAVDAAYDKAYIAMAQAYEEEGDYKNAAKWYEKFASITKSEDMRKQALGWKQEAEHNLELLAKAQPKEEQQPSGKSVEEAIREEREKAVAVAVAEANEKSDAALAAAKEEIKKLRQAGNELRDSLALANEQKEGLERKLAAFKDSDDVAAMLKSLEATEIGPELAQQVVKLKNDNTSLASRVRNLDEANARLREENSTLKAYIKNGEASKTVSAKLDDLNRRYSALQEQKAAADAQLKELKAQTAQALNAAKDSASLEDKAQALALALADKNAEIAALQKTVEEKSAKVASLESQTAALTLPEGVAAKDISEEITSLRKDIATLQKQGAAKDTQIAYLKNELNKENGGVTRSEAELIKRENAALHQQVAAATEAVKGEQARVAEVKKQMDAQKEALRTVPPMATMEQTSPAGTAIIASGSASGASALGPAFNDPGVLKAQSAGTTTVASTPAPVATVQPVSQGQTFQNLDRPLSKRPKVYQVKRGDTLYGIAQKFYGDSQQWRKILRYNKEDLKGSTALKVGQRLYIPD